MSLKFFNFHIAKQFQVLIEEFENYLTRRGLGPEFSSTLFEMSAEFEHHSYVDFLKNVRDFVN